LVCSAGQYLYIRHLNICLCSFNEQAR